MGSGGVEYGLSFIGRALSSAWFQGRRRFGSADGRRFSLLPMLTTTTRSLSCQRCGATRIAVHVHPDGRSVEIRSAEGRACTAALTGDPATDAPRLGAIAQAYDKALDGKCAAGRCPGLARAN